MISHSISDTKSVDRGPQTLVAESSLREYVRYARRAHVGSAGVIHTVPLWNALSCARQKRLHVGLVQRRRWRELEVVEDLALDAHDSIV